MGMHVYLLTDMLAVSPPLEAYLERTVGGLDVDDPALWSVYQAGLSELFDSMPFVDGLMVRIGEGGSVYQAGWDYSSKLAVTSESSVQAMLRRAAGDRRRARPRHHLPHLDRRRRRGRRPAHQPGVVRGGARRHRRPAPDRVDEVHDGRLLQPPAAQPDAGDGHAAPHRRVPGPPRVRGVRRAAERPGRRGGAGAAARSSPRTRTSRASGTGRRTAARCAPDR